MEKRIILFLVLSMAVIVLYPYLLEKMVSPNGWLRRCPGPSLQRRTPPRRPR